MHNDQTNRDNLIDELLDQMLAGTTTHSEFEASDPDATATIRRLRQLDTAPAADPNFVTNQWEKLMYTQPGAFLLQQNLEPTWTGERLSQPDSGKSRRQWPQTAFATVLAAMFLLTVGFWQRDSLPGGFLNHGTEGPAIMAPSTPVPEPFAVDWKVKGGDTGFNNPTALAIGPDGNIWVADSGNNRFQIFTPEGKFVETWGEPGSDDGQFQLERFNSDGYGAVIFLSDGSFVVLDPGNHRIQYFAADRAFVRSVGTAGTDPGQFSDPVGIAVGSDDTVLVLDEVRGDVQTFDKTGKLVSAIPLATMYTGHNSMNALAVDEAGNLVIAEIGLGDGPHVVQTFDATGTLLSTIGDDPADQQFSAQPQSIAIDPDGNLFANQWDEEASVLVFDASGVFVMAIAPTAEQPDVPWTTTGAVLDGEGNLYLTDTTSKTLTKIRLGPPIWPLDVAATPVP